MSPVSGAMFSRWQTVWVYNMSEDTKEALVLISIVVLVGALMFAAGFACGVDNTRKEAAKRGYGEFRVDPLKGGDAKFYWSTNKFEINQ